MALDLDRIVATLNQAAEKMPPVQSWQPAVKGTIDILIDDNMQWFHEGGVFQREALVKLLASILRIEDDGYYLVTPAEKLRIEVADVPFKIIAMLQQDDAYYLITNTEDRIRLDDNTVWQLRRYNEVEIPYVDVRHGLFARVDRAVFYQMVEQAELSEDGKSMYLISAKRPFLLGHVEN